MHRLLVVGTGLSPAFWLKSGRDTERALQRGSRRLAGGRPVCGGHTGGLPTSLLQALSLMGGDNRALVTHQTLSHTISSVLPGPWPGDGPTVYPLQVADGQGCHGNTGRPLRG